MSKQLALALRAPAEHGEFVHFQRRHGTVLLWDQQAIRRSWEKIQPLDDLSAAMGAHVGQPDRYFSPNEFTHWRRVNLLSSLRACYVDLDQAHNWPALLDALGALLLPEPSLVVESGRGLHLYWVLDAAPAKALPVWQAIQDTLVTKLQPFGADPAARDCTRMLRIVGSLNGKNAAEVKGWLISPRRWTLHELANEVLGPRKGVVRSLEGARVKREASVHQRTGPYRLWHDRYQDLCKIADHHAFMRPQGVSEGHRDILLFLLSVALGWFTDARGLQEHIERLAKTYMPSLSAREVSAYMKPVLYRAQAAAKGEKFVWEGKLWDPRYAFKTITLRNWLGPLITPQLEPQLIALGQPKSEAEKEAIRSQQKAVHEKTRSRQQEGRYQQTRAEYTGKATERGQRARALRDQGLTHEAIAVEIGISRRRVGQILGGGREMCTRPCIAPAG